MQFNTDFEKISRLYDLGHFYNPKFPETLNLSKEDLSKLTLDDKIVKEALQSFREMMLEPSELNLLGDSDLFNIPRCGYPDYENPKFLGKVGTGSFPEPCQKAGILVHINKSRMPSAIKDRWAEIQRQTFAAYHSIGANLIETDDPSKAQIRVWWEVLMGSTIGLAQFNSRSCSGWVFCKLDPGYTGLMFELFTHELGHNCNLNHTNGGIMHPSVREVNPKTWNKNDPSYNTLVRYFGGVPITPPVPPDDNQPLNKVEIDLTNNSQLSNIVVDFPNKELLVTRLGGKKSKFILMSNEII